ncbi:carboxypeptidase-like regulatory domain-containing protein [Mesonia aquimarina]|uniref:carboxypeptidase-like regulatory domain-containing protein n=1 Tax=Mesonia aquimarina TaxID=1504967 RepID=UPI000EF61AA7|nr:carboxypeptidase-like regulatory domain-containing protein [Mesonia aquimarina]
MIKKNVFLLLLIFLFQLKSFAQTIEGFVTDEKGFKLPFVNLLVQNTKHGTATNQKGFYSLDISNFATDTLLVSFLGYKKELLALHEFKADSVYTFNITLKANEEILSSVIVKNREVKFGWRQHIIGRKRKGGFVVSNPFGHETITLLKNGKGRLGKLEALILKFKKRETNIYKSFGAYYRIKFYRYDEINKKPGAVLSEKSILLKPENKNQRTKIDLAEYNILFPKSGICVGIETINPNEQLPENNMYVTTPNLLWTHDKKSLSWTSFRGGEKHKIVRTSEFKKGFYQNPFVKIKVVFAKG